MSGLIDDFDLFIFDWDGTISTSSVLVRLSHYFKRRYNPEYIRSHESEFRQPRSVNSPFGANRMRLANFFYGLYTFFVRTHLREGAIEMLEILKKKNKKVALFTDGSRHRVEAELKRLGMAKYFDIIISAESIRV
ncbi:MAG: HAD family hydrolase, partial [Candidatus Micrarchaeota archaeon]|nr:HAD family hydrolase [Candidatus Micrarchaeota archaeon]